MGIFNWIFGSKRHQLIDEDLGSFNSYKTQKEIIYWVGNIPFLGDGVSLEILGNLQQLDPRSKSIVLSLQEHSDIISTETDLILKNYFEKAGLEYTQWKEHFRCSSISINNHQTIITFMQLKTYMRYDIYFNDSKAINLIVDIKEKK